MFAAARVIVAAVLLLASSAAIAQLVPPSEQPGRQRERFEIPSGPLAQPGGPAIGTPSLDVPPGADAVILGCTEIGLLLEQEHVDLPVFDSTLLHADAALDFALAPRERVA